MLSSTSTSPFECVSAGSGRIRVSPHGRVTEAYAASPLRLLLPDNHGRAAWVFASSFGGGLVDGDGVSIDLEVEAGAAAFFSTQASTKVYRSPHGTSAELRARVGDEALLVVAPDPVVCFAAARYRQRQTFALAPSASLVAIDWMTSGRWASGERWAFREYEASLSVRLGDSLLLHDVLTLSADDRALPLAARMGRFEVLALAVLVNISDAADIIARINARPVERRASLLVGVSALGTLGCVIRVAGTSVEQVGRALRDYLACIPALLGDDPWARKW